MLLTIETLQNGACVMMSYVAEGSFMVFCQSLLLFCVCAELSKVMLSDRAFSRFSASVVWIFHSFFLSCPFRTFPASQHTVSVVYEVGFVGRSADATLGRTVC